MLSSAYISDHLKMHSQGPHPVCELCHKGFPHCSKPSHPRSAGPWTLGPRGLTASCASLQRALQDPCPAGRPHADPSGGGCPVPGDAPQPQPICWGDPGHPLGTGEVCPMATAGAVAAPPTAVGSLLGVLGVPLQSWPFLFIPLPYNRSCGPGQVIVFQCPLHIPHPSPPPFVRTPLQ
ncbi:hypothetical protein Celaphus_00012315 [Cervus elaphus hippelaphus]|uniref:C2H2-type domain-containing protein n=1 Tax=Cervus elaphus hippelaphus TaxID=46360 RepID=A0A212CKU1_CEREH|nr:hypothetical protein Celaphus_00012315 [Cervus elaphus hippelaphus]